MSRPPFEPLDILAVLEKHRVAYVVIGKLAAIIHGTGGITDGVDLCPQAKDVNVVRLQRALEELGARGPRNALVTTTLEGLGEQPITRLKTPIGEIGLVPDPAGTRGGWDDLRRRATREPLGGGVRAPIAAIEDLVRIAAAAESGRDGAEIEALRLVAERTRGRGLAR